MIYDTHSENTIGKRLQSNSFENNWPFYFFIFPGNFVEQFECLVCTRVAKNMEMTKIGFGKMPYQANSDHYGCPAPDTGYSLSDQHISSPIKPKYDDLFCQIYKNLHKMFWNTKLAELTLWISEQFV